MKNLRNLGLSIVAVMLMGGLANAQSQFHKLPRVKVDSKKIEYTKNNKQTKNEVKTTVTETSFIAPVETKTNVEVVSTTPTVETASTSTENTVVTSKAKTKVVAKKEVKKSTKTVSSSEFTKKVKTNSKLMDIKDTKKSAMEKWLMWMLILLGAGLIFIIVGVVLWLVAFSPIGWIFYVLGALCFTAAGVMLILGLTGVI